MAKWKRWWIEVLILVAGFSLVGSSWAAEFPTKNIEILAPFGATASSALSLRVMADALSKILGKQVLVVPAPGAGGTIAANRVAKAKPDGYTLLGANPASVVTSLYLQKDVTYKISDFEFLAEYGVLDLGLSVKPNSPLKTLEDYIDYARKHPSELKQAISGYGTIGHLCFELLKLKAGGLKIDTVPFKTPYEMRTAVLGGHCDASFIYGGTGGPTDEIRQMLADGGRILAVATRHRLKAYPDIPTLKEKGYDVAFSAWWGIAGPRGMPREVSEKLKKALYQVVKDPQVVQDVEKSGFRIEFRNSEEFTNLVKEDDNTIKKVVKEAKLQVD